jgi:hypothetical protein
MKANKEINLTDDVKNSHIKRRKNYFKKLIIFHTLNKYLYKNVECGK